MNKTFVIVLIACMNMIVPLSLDMYLPAVPHMTAAFGTTESLVNLTLVGFFFFMAVGTLLFGPLSDKYGRKMLLLAGTLVYAVFSAGCALATSIWLLIVARVLQALGAGCMVAISTAMIKDCFDRRTRDTILAIVQAMAVIAPMLAPIVGAFIVTHAGWRATFAVLAVLGALCTAAVACLKETLPAAERYRGTLAGSLGLLVGGHAGCALYGLYCGVLLCVHRFLWAFGNQLQLLLRVQFCGSDSRAHSLCEGSASLYAAHDDERVSDCDGALRGASAGFRQFAAAGVYALFPAVYDH